MGPRQETISVGPESSKPEGGVVSSGFRMYPIDRDIVLKSGSRWMKGRRKDADIGDLWRIHDKLYDVTDFIDKHPGGRMWLEETRGTDITEVFESSHVWETAHNILPKYFVKDAQGPRSNVFTFHEDGFYKTLKRRARPILRKAGRGPSWGSYVVQDGLALSFATFALLAAYHGSYAYAGVAGFFLACTGIVAHNFYHQRDNWHMYMFDLMLMSSHELRIVHAASHHPFPNTHYDAELSALEPFYDFFPNPNKSWPVRYGSLVYGFIIDAVAFPVHWLTKNFLIIKGEEKLRPENLLPFGQLLVMWALCTSFMETFWLWSFMHFSCSFWFIEIGLATSHHHPDIYHEGDKFREDDPDWGLCQMDTIGERVEVSGRLPLVLVSFGDHILHHLFPTVDHSKLKLLYPVLNQTCKEFGVSYKMVTQADLILGKYKQFMNATPNPNPPGVQRQKEE